ncbi:MAG TPA: TonB family protein [Steroidobacteraceae bacterium]
MNAELEGSPATAIEPEFRARSDKPTAAAARVPPLFGAASAKPLLPDHAPPVQISAASFRGRQPAARSLSRQLVFLLVLGLHVVLIGLLLSIKAPQNPTVAIAPIETELLTENRTPEQAPPLPQVQLDRPRTELVVPPVDVSVPAPEAPIAIPLTPVAPPVAQTPAPSVPATAPRFDAAYLKNPAPVYPAASRRQHEQGTVTLKVRVSSQGTALEVQLDHTSGSAALDTAAINAVRLWRFVPAQRGATPVEAWVLIPVEFALHR